MKTSIVAIALFFILCESVWSQESPELVLQKGHTEPVLAVSQIADTDFLASVSLDGSVNIWELQSRSIVRTLYNEDSKGVVLPFASAGFAPDGTWVAVIDRAGTIRRLSLPDGKLLAEFQAPKPPGSWGNGIPSNPLLATDGKAIIYVPGESVSVDGLFKLGLDGQLIGKIDSSGGTRWWSAAGGRIVLTDLNHLSVYSMDTLELQAQSEIRAGGVAGVALHSTGSKLAVSNLRGVEVLNSDTLEVLADLPCTEENGPNETRFWPIWEGDNLYAFAYANAANGQKLYRADYSNSSLEACEAEVKARFGTALSDGRLCLGGFGINCYVVDPNSEDKLSLEGDTGGYTSFAIAPSGDLFTGGRQGDVKHWSGTTGQLLRTFPGLGLVTKLDVAPDGKHLAAGDVLGKTICWELETGKEVGLIEGRLRSTSHDEVEVTNLSFLDNDRLFRKARNEPVKLYSLSGEILDTWKLHGEPIALDTLGRRLADGSVQEVSLQDKRKAILDQRFDSSATALLYDGLYLLVGTESGSFYRWDYSDPEKKPELLVKVEGGQVVRSIAASSSHLTLLCSGKNYGELVELSREGRVQRTVRLEGKSLRDLSFTKGGRVMASGPDYTLQFYDRESGKRLGSLMGVRDNEGWVALESDGHFDGNSTGLQSVSFELGGQAYKVDQFLEDYLQPGALARLLGDLKDVAQPRTPQLTASTVKKPPKISIQTPKSGDTIEGDSVVVKLRVSDMGGGVGKLTFSHNGHRLSQSRISSVGEGVYEVIVAPVKGVNDFAATAFEAGNSVESRADRCRVTAPNVEERPPRLHMLSVGIDAYKAGLELNLAAVDSESISEQFSSGLYQRGERLHLTNDKATLIGIRQAVAQLKEKADPQDAFVLYLAGHGTVVDDTYYFLPHDVNLENDETLVNSSLSSEELAHVLREIPATKQLIILDSCKSGAAVGVLAARSGLEEIRSQHLLAKTSGTFLIAATKADDYAYEVPELGHGVLTFAILEALGKTAKSESAAQAQLTANDLLRSVSSRVPVLSQKYQGINQQVLQYSCGQDFVLEDRSR